MKKHSSRNLLALTAILGNVVLLTLGAYWMNTGDCTSVARVLSQVLGAQVSALRRRNLLRFAAAAPDGPCPAPFYLFTPDEAESIYPSLKECSLSVYAERWHSFMTSHPARVLRLQDAAFAVWPGYTASEENWPVYGNKSANDARPGKRCYEGAIAPALDTAARLLRSEGDGPKHLLVIDLFAWGWREGYAPFYNAANGLVWAKLEPLAGTQWRPEIDISVPPPPHYVAMPVAPLFNATAQQRAEATAWKPPALYEVFVSFKGRFSTNDVRAVLGQLHEPSQGVVIVNSELHAAESISAVAGRFIDTNLTRLMRASAFSLAPRGHARWSYRFTEAVCSGSVPVVVGADGWLMPLDRLAPFNTYGIAVSAANATATIELLRAIPEQERLRKAAAARAVCQRWLGSPERIAQAVLTELTMKLLAAVESDADITHSTGKG